MQKTGRRKTMAMFEFVSASGLKTLTPAERVKYLIELREGCKLVFNDDSGAIIYSREGYETVKKRIEEALEKK